MKVLQASKIGKVIDQLGIYSMVDHAREQAMKSYLSQEFNYFKRVILSYPV